MKLSDILKEKIQSQHNLCLKSFTLAEELGRKYKGGSRESCEETNAMIQAQGDGGLTRAVAGRVVNKDQNLDIFRKYFDLLIYGFQ